MVEQTPRNQNLDANISFNRLADAITGIATRQRPQAATMLKPVSTNTLFFDGKNEKFELFEDLFHTMLKMQPEMTEAMKSNHFHAHLRKEAPQTFRNISASNKKTLDDVLIVFRRIYVKPESQATAKHKWHNPNTKSLPDILEELNECAERAFGENAQHMIDSLLYAKLPPLLKQPLNLAYLENGTYDQIVAHLERELELSGLENDGELKIPTMIAIPPNENQQNTEQTKIVYHYCKKPGHVVRDYRKRIGKEQKQRNDRFIQNMKPSTSKSFPPCPHCQRTNHPPEKCWSTISHLKFIQLHLTPVNNYIDVDYTSQNHTRRSPAQTRTRQPAVQSHTYNPLPLARSLDSHLLTLSSLFYVVKYFII